MEEKKIMDLIGVLEPSPATFNCPVVLGVISLEPPTVIEFAVYPLERVEDTISRAYEDCVDYWVDDVREGKTLLGYADWFAQNLGSDRVKIERLYDLRFPEVHEAVLEAVNAEPGSVVSAAGGFPLISVENWLPGKRAHWEEAIKAGWRAVGRENAFVAGEW